VIRDDTSLVFRLLKRLPTHPITKKEKKHFSLRGTFLFGDAISGVNFPTARRDTMTRHELPVPRLPHEGTDSLGKVQTSHWLGPKHGAPEWKKKDDLKRKYFRFLSFSVLSRKRSCMTIEDGGVTGKLWGTWALPPACCPVCHLCGMSYPALCAAVVLRPTLLGSCFNACRHLLREGINQGELAGIVKRGKSGLLGSQSPTSRACFTPSWLLPGRVSARLPQLN
jgi:ribosomal protein S14